MLSKQAGGRTMPKFTVERSVTLSTYETLEETTFIGADNYIDALRLAKKHFGSNLRTSLEVGSNYGVLEVHLQGPLMPLANSLLGFVTWSD